MKSILNVSFLNSALKFTPTSGRGTPRSAFTRRILVVMLLAAPFLSGCASEAIRAGDIVSITQRTFGVKVGQAPANGSPEVTLGLIATTVQFTPTSTNALYAPKYANTFKIGQSAVPFTFDVDETIASGDVQTGTKTNLTSVPVIPANGPTQ